MGPLVSTMLSTEGEDVRFKVAVNLTVVVAVQMV